MTNPDLADLRQMARRPQHYSNYTLAGALHTALDRLDVAELERDTAIAALAAAQERNAKERGVLYAIIENAVSIGERDPSGLVLSALGFNLLDPRWRLSFNGWERQADEAQAGYFPATDWIEELLASREGGQAEQPLSIQLTPATTGPADVCPACGCEDEYVLFVRVEDDDGNETGEISCEGCGWIWLPIEATPATAVRDGGETR